MKKILCLLTALMLVLCVPMVAGASEYPTIDDYRVTIEYDDQIEYRFLSWYGNVEVEGTLPIGQRLTYGGNYTYGIRLYLDFNLNDYLSKYMSMIQNATNAWFQISLDVDVAMTPAGNGTENKVNLYYCENDTAIVTNSTPFEGNYISGKASFSPWEVTNFRNITADDVISTGIEFYSYTGSSITYRQCEIIMRSYTIVLYLEGVDGQAHDQFIVITNKLDDIESAVNNVRDEVKVMQGQLDNIDNSINQGFGQMGDKLDGVQDSINQGFGGILTPDSDDQQAAGGFLDKVEDNKQDAADINDQLSSVSKPDPDNLRDELSPDQFIDKDDASVQEMSGIIASVFGIDIMVKYILLLLGLGLISLVFFGKKEG